jgi:hypothetical protein
VERRSQLERGRDSEAVISRYLKANGTKIREMGEIAKMRSLYSWLEELIERRDRDKF